MKARVKILSVLLCALLSVGMLCGLAACDSSDTDKGGGTNKIESAGKDEETEKDKETGKSNSEILSSVYKNIANVLLGDDESGRVSARASAYMNTAARADGNDLFVSASDKTVYFSTAAMVYFTALVYESPKITDADKPVKFTAEYPTSNGNMEHFVISLFSTIDKEGNRIKAYVKCEYDNGNPTELYVFDIGYVFATEKINDFVLMNAQFESGAIVTASQYKSEVLTTLNQACLDKSVLTQAITAEKQRFVTALQGLVDLQTNFTAEYSTAMAYLIANAYPEMNA